LPFLVSRLVGIERRIFVVLPFGLGLGFVERGHNQYLVNGLRRHLTRRLWVDRPGLCFPRRLNRATMQRIPIDERANWRDHAEKTGFSYHSINGEPYWDETAYYAFSLRQIEDDLEAPTAALEAMCIELVGRAITDEQIMKRLAIPERFWNFIAASWKRGDASLYGRFDLRYDGQGPAKLLEYNADTPTSLFETAVFQWDWLNDAIVQGIVPRDADQFNSLHERLIAAWKSLLSALPARSASGGSAPDAPQSGRTVHFAGMLDNPRMPARSSIWRTHRVRPAPRPSSLRWT
jgi:Glutathionylspermidine synthase preATP-grasp